MGRSDAQVIAGWPAVLENNDLLRQALDSATPREWQARPEGNAPRGWFVLGSEGLAVHNQRGEREAAENAVHRACSVLLLSRIGVQ
jgi:hypothetical protein